MNFLKKISLTPDEKRAALLIAPAVILIFFVAIIPIINIFYLSLFRKVLIFDITKFIGFDNYRHLLVDQRFWNSFFNNVNYSFFSVAIELVLGLTIALILNQSFKARWLIRTAILIPWILPTVIASKFWNIILDPQYGLANKILLNLHIIDKNINWLGDPFWAMKCAIMVDVWKYTPFLSLLLLGGLQLIPKELYEAAILDGTNKLQSFKNITLPLLMPTMLVALLFRTMDSFSAFSVVYVLTNGGPADSTELMSLYSYKTLFQSLQFGYGAAISVIIFLCVLLISIFYLYSFSYKTKDVD